MRVRSADAAGFSLVEVIIAMFILGIIAVALLPVLINGIQFSSQQASVATATRQLNALIEEARDSPSCATVAAARANQTFTTGNGGTFETSGTSGACSICPNTIGTAIPLQISAVQAGRNLATVSAEVYVPGAKAAATCT